MKVAFAGESGSYAELAGREYFGLNAKLISVQEFSDVFNAVANEKCNYGVIPIENSMAGSIHQNYDLLLESKLHIAGEIFLRVGHFLIGNKSSKLTNITHAFSHPQALAQCKNYLKKKNIVPVPCSNTAFAVKKVRDEKLLNAAAISSMKAAADFDMKILDSNIEDNEWNTTRFLILSRTRKILRKADEPRKTSIVFSIKNIPGALFKCLAVFALRDIDLFKIESRPVNGRGFEYIFYLDFAGDLLSEDRKNAINHLQEITTFYRSMGSYPIGRHVNPECNP